MSVDFKETKFIIFMILIATEIECLFVDTLDTCEYLYYISCSFTLTY